MIVDIPHAKVLQIWKQLFIAALSHRSFLGKNFVKFKGKNLNVIPYIYFPFNCFIL